LRWYPIALDGQGFLDALGRSLNIALLTTIISVILGYIAALVLTRNEKGVRLLSMISLGPLFVASAVLGLAFLMVLSQVGLLGSYQGLLIAYTVITLPFTTRMIAGVLSGIGTEIEQVAQVYGATKFRAIREVNFP